MLNSLSSRLRLKTISLAILFSSTVLLTACGTYQTIKVQSHTQSHTPVHSRSDIDIAFSHTDRSLIRGYHIFNQPRHSRGKAKGHYKKRFKRHQRLPHDYEYHHLPKRLERKLSPLPKDFIRVQIGTEFIMMNMRTRVIHDVIYTSD